MAKTGAERQAASIARLRSRAARADQLADEVARLEAELERLESELGDALEPGRPPRCRVHGCELACPQCHSQGGWDTA